MRFTDDEWMLMMLYSLAHGQADCRASDDAKKSDGQRQKPAQVDGLAACETGRDDRCRI